MLGDKIKNLRKNEGLTQKALSDVIDVSRSAIGMLEKNLQGVGNETLIKLASFFNVSYDFLSNDAEIDSCPLCGALYCPLEKEDFDSHKIRHNNFLNFSDRDLFLIYSDREAIKRKYHEILQKNNSSILEKVDAAIKLYQCWYARSIEDNNFDIKHPSFDEYIAMMLNRENSKKDLSTPVYDLLVQRYGLKEGIPNGKSYYDFNNNQLSKKAERDIQKSLSETLGMLKNSQDALMFDGEPLELDDLTRELLAQSLENSMRMAKKIAKEKYTPKKFKK